LAGRAEGGACNRVESVFLVGIWHQDRVVYAVTLAKFYEPGEGRNTFSTHISLYSLAVLRCTVINVFARNVATDESDSFDQRVVT
jgi:hypothetical protein